MKKEIFLFFYVFSLFGNGCFSKIKDNHIIQKIDPFNKAKYVVGASLLLNNFALAMSKSADRKDISAYIPIVNFFFFDPQKDRKECSMQFHIDCKENYSKISKIDRQDYIRVKIFFDLLIGGGCLLYKLPLLEKSSSLKKFTLKSALFTHLALSSFIFSLQKNRIEFSYLPLLLRNFKDELFNLFLEDQEIKEEEIFYINSGARVEEFKKTAYFKSFSEYGQKIFTYFKEESEQEELAVNGLIYIFEKDKHKYFLRFLLAKGNKEQCDEWINTEYEEYEEDEEWMDGEDIKLIKKLNDHFREKLSKKIDVGDSCFVLKITNVLKIKKISRIPDTYYYYNLFPTYLYRIFNKYVDENKEKWIRSAKENIFYQNLLSIPFFNSFALSYYAKNKTRPSALICPVGQMLIALNNIIFFSFLTEKYKKLSILGGSLFLSSGLLCLYKDYQFEIEKKEKKARERAERERV